MRAADCWDAVIERDGRIISREEAIEHGRYFGRNFVSKFPLTGMDAEDAEQEGALIGFMWWTYYIHDVDLWTYVRRRFADLSRSCNGRVPHELTEIDIKLALAIDD